MQRAVLGYLALTAALIGAWAQFAPRSFYDDFPGIGAPWVSVDGPYNEHLVRDVGGLYLAMTVVLVAAGVTLLRPMVLTAAVAMLATGVPHLIYHLFHTDGLSSSSVAASISGLVAIVGLPILLLVSGSRHAGSSG